MTFAISQATDILVPPLSGFLSDEGLQCVGAVGPNGQLVAWPRTTALVDRLERVSRLPIAIVRVLTRRPHVS
jgi:hypothetical protein